jgi:hypothetical protein
MSILSDYLNEVECAAELKISIRTLKRYRALRCGPPFTMVGNRKYYSIPAIRDWLASRQIKPVRNKKRQRV